MTIILTVKAYQKFYRYKQERDCLVHFVRLANNKKVKEKVHETITFLLAKYSPILIFFSLTDSAIK